MVGLRQYWSGVSVLKNEIELHFINQIRQGYFWIFPVNNEIANIGIGMSHGQLRSQNSSPKQILENVIDSGDYHTPVKTRYFDGLYQCFREDHEKTKHFV